VILFEFELVQDLLRYIDEWLILASPVGRANDPRPGHPELYARSHRMFLDGDLAEVDAPPRPFSEAVFVSTVPYARKIERGLSNQAPDGVYQVVATLAARRYSNYARIRFGYRTPHDFGAIAEWSRTTRLQSHAASRNRPGPQRQEWLQRQPAIIITVT
jgi:hypothetical protein